MTHYIKIPEQLSIVESPEFRERVNAMEFEAKDTLVLDFSTCTFIDSTGLGALVGLYKRCSDLGVKLELNQMRQDVKRIFQITKLDQIFDIR